MWETRKGSTKSSTAQWRSSKLIINAGEKVSIYHTQRQILDSWSSCVKSASTTPTSYRCQLNSLSLNYTFPSLSLSSHAHHFFNWSCWAQLPFWFALEQIHLHFLTSLKSCLFLDINHSQFLSHVFKKGGKVNRWAVKGKFSPWLKCLSTTIPKTVGWLSAARWSAIMVIFYLFYPSNLGLRFTWCLLLYLYIFVHLLGFCNVLIFASLPPCACPWCFYY